MQIPVHECRISTVSMSLYTNVIQSTVDDLILYYIAYHTVRDETLVWVFV